MTTKPTPTGADNYELGDEIARGGIGSVLEAEDTKLKRSVAVKIMMQDADANEMMRHRFVREAEILATLDHPNIVPVYDIVWEDEIPLLYSMKKVHILSQGAKHQAGDLVDRH
jgi:serine/threonine protein kinase